MSLGKVGIKFRKTWVKFGLSLDKVSNLQKYFIVNSLTIRNGGLYNENSSYLCKIF